MNFLTRRVIFVLCLIIINVFSCTKGEHYRVLPSSENIKDPEVLLRQTQSTFVQWVLSLLPAQTNNFNVSTADSTLNSFANETDLKPESTPNNGETSTVPSLDLATQSNSSQPSEPTTPKPDTPLVPQRNCSSCVCGIANTQKRIVGGQETEVHQYPWMAMLLYGGRYYCAGSLINDQYVVTAAHCVYGFRRERITVRLLEHDWKMSNAQKIDRRVMKIFTHPKYNIRTYDNDIAILKLSEPIEMTELLHPVCLPTPGKSFKGETGIAIGWGALKYGGQSSDTLQVGMVSLN